MESDLNRSEKALCIIPARGGSKRIPGKNVKLFHGKPIIAYSIETALESELFSEVMVSTDDAEIARIARNFGATVPFLRSEVNSNDFATTLDVIEEVKSNYKKLGQVFADICCLYATAPLVTPQRIRQGFDLLKSCNVSFAMTAFSYPVWRGLKRKDDKSMEFAWPEYKNSRSQDLPPIFHDAGQWYWFKNSDLSNGIFGAHCKGLELTAIEVQDIDTLDDWQIAELKYAYLHDSR